ncbi:TetR/AcrR family transcriptional regulator [Nocardia cyriacigeorgica]|uniref:Transcriptional regulator TetR family n=2 Tax=Nocardia cyriacigeorgica TaxID=135487 RepID=H6R8L9_NOCCG|nr:TetR/AcrR family transcriptional regulator [Nocardia cyriacigeorgica]MBF6084889.1 TetR/AcrR family transcriptional regulator [Nocardia cyriacigeorgica]NEW34836.1 TetR/AcrR family transcriptional regulator [Nocardia cyriacigeorgica]CCF61047.1 transcriptional regulator TetR family [Nocardia cyriacigeorgica GUH-2]BDT84470.1 TetR family transcriptional regulator [Nocardia cyriacigeorgica]BDU03965.1 TetR family transcriptional regulator [Nocardia cyriacigeorgica]
MTIRESTDAVVAGGGTKQAIRDAAVELFTNKGFEQTSLREVADAVGITKASLYYHYASKLDLLLAIIDPVIDHMRSVVEDIDAVPYNPEGIRAVLRAYVRGMVRHRDAGAMCMRDTVAIVNAMADRYPDVAESTRQLRRWLAGPDPTDEALLRASAALEILGVALLSTEVVPDAPDELVEKTLLDAATCVLTAHRAA